MERSSVPYKGKTYPLVVINDERLPYPVKVGGLSLEEKLITEGEYSDYQAKLIDETIAYYIPDSILSFSEKDILTELRKTDPEFFSILD